MRVLITGGAGFVGSHLVDRLLAEGHAVDVVDDLSGGTLANLAAARAEPGRHLTIHQLDVRDPELAGLMDRRQPEVVYHLARPPQGAAVSGDGDPAADLAGVLQVLAAARTAGAPKVVVTAGAADLYAEPQARQLPLKESHAQEPHTLPGVGRRAVLDALRVYRDHRTLEHTVLALGEVYGPRQLPAAGPVAALAAALTSGGAGAVPGDGRRTADFVFVDDVVDALARAATRGSGLLLNVGTGRETSFNALYGVVAAAAGVDRRPAGGPESPGAPRRFCLEPSRARLHLGWEPWTDLVDGATATVAWWRDRNS